MPGFVPGSNASSIHEIIPTPVTHSPRKPQVNPRFFPINADPSAQEGARPAADMAQANPCHISYLDTRLTLHLSAQSRHQSDQPPRPEYSPIGMRRPHLSHRNVRLSERASEAAPSSTKTTAIALRPQMGSSDSQPSTPVTLRTLFAPRVCQSPDTTPTALFPRPPHR